MHYYTAHHQPTYEEHMDELKHFLAMKFYFNLKFSSSAFSKIAIRIKCLTIISKVINNIKCPLSTLSDVRATVNMSSAEQNLFT